MLFPPPRCRIPLLTLALYAALLIVIAGSRPLWVDEILQLVVTSDGSAHDVVDWAARNPGGVPSAYLVQWLLLKVAPLSPLAARLPSIVFAIATLVLVDRLARKLILPAAGPALWLLALAPIQFRYAIEARPYVQALCFTVLASLTLVRLAESPTMRRWLCYSLCLTACLYTQPFSFFVCAGHFVWAASLESPSAERWILSAAVAAGLAFAPWFLLAGPHWAEAVAANHYRFDASFETARAFLRDSSGAGYVGTAMLIFFAVIGLTSKMISQSTKALLLVSTLVPIPCVFVADATFGYFFAARQLLWILPPLCLLAGVGIKMALGRRQVVLAMVVALFVVHDVRYALGAREDWDLAASTLSTAVQISGACAIVAPPESVALYQFFEPSVSRERCDPNQPNHTAVLLVRTPYTEESTGERQGRLLLDAGLSPGPTITSGGTRLTLYLRVQDTADLN